MFFIMGMSHGEKQLDYSKTVICGECGRYGRYEVFMTYMYLSFFFIPLFKWNKHYYVRMSCCGTIYELDPEIGGRIARGENVEIDPEDMQKVNMSRSSYYEQYRQSEAYDQYEGRNDADGKGTAEAGAETKGTAKMLPGSSNVRICPSCGYVSPEDYEYCPKCGRKL